MSVRRENIIRQSAEPEDAGCETDRSGQTVRRRVHRGPLLVLVAGLTVIVLYFLLSAYKVGSIGQPSDIGGGAILYLSYVITIGGIVWVVVDLFRPRT